MRLVLTTSSVLDSYPVAISSFWGQEMIGYESGFVRRSLGKGSDSYPVATVFGCLGGVRRLDTRVDWHAGSLARVFSACPAFVNWPVQTSSVLFSYSIAEFLMVARLKWASVLEIFAHRLIISLLPRVCSLEGDSSKEDIN